MSVSVVIPFRSQCSHRLRALGWVMHRWAKHGHQVVVESDTGDDGPWRKAVALRAAISIAQGNVLVITDADVWSDQVLKAIEIVEAGQASWVTPHRSVCRFDEAATEEILDGADPASLHVGQGRRALAEDQHGARFGGGIMVIRRKVWETCPMDPRFVGWGGEDEAWGYALETLFEGQRLVGPLWHLWHPHQPRLSRAHGSRANEELRRRYQRACWKPDEMLMILGEAKAA